MTIRLGFTAALMLALAPVTLRGQARPDSLHYSTAISVSTRSLGPQHVRQTDSSSGGHRHVGLGLVLGFVTGTLAGIAIESGGPHGEGRALNQLKGAIGGATIGTIIGGIVGFFWRTGK